MDLTSQLGEQYSHQGKKEIKENLEGFGVAHPWHLLLPLVDHNERLHSRKCVAYWMHSKNSYTFIGAIV